MPATGDPNPIQRVCLIFMKRISESTAAVKDKEELFIMGPHPNNLNNFFVIQDLIDEPMLNVDAP
jgi:hypothetical protein